MNILLFLLKSINKLVSVFHLPKDEVRKGLCAILSKRIEVSDVPLYLNDKKDVDLGPLLAHTPPQLYDMFLSQVRMNYSRISTLHDSNIDHHVFATTCRAKHQYFPTEYTTNSHLKRIEQALNEHDFGKYSLLCSMS